MPGRFGGGGVWGWGRSLLPGYVKYRPGCCVSAPPCKAPSSSSLSQLLSASLLLCFLRFRLQASPIACTLALAFSLSHSCVCFRVSSPDIPPLLFIVSFFTVNRNREFFHFVHPCCSWSVFASFWFGLVFFFFFGVGFWSSAYTFVCSPLRDLVFCAVLYRRRHWRRELEREVCVCVCVCVCERERERERLFICVLLDCHIIACLSSFVRLVKTDVKTSSLSFFFSKIFLRLSANEALFTSVSERGYTISSP